MSFLWKKQQPKTKAIGIIPPSILWRIGSVVHKQNQFGRLLLPIDEVNLKIATETFSKQNNHHKLINRKGKKGCESALICFYSSTISLGDPIHTHYITFSGFQEIRGCSMAIISFFLM